MRETGFSTKLRRGAGHIKKLPGNMIKGAIVHKDVRSGQILGLCQNTHWSDRTHLEIFRTHTEMVR